MTTTSLQRGSLVDGIYRIDQVIGCGGMSSVYRARHCTSSRAVALKIIDPGDTAGGEVRRAVFNELLLSTRVRHPNLVEVLDFGVLATSGRPYIVMDLLHGRTLHHHLRTAGPIPEAVALPLFLGVVDAMRLAHAQGIVHKDLKPSNLFLRRFGTPDATLVVLDFGVAVRVSGGTDLDLPYGSTPRYSPPEYLQRGLVGPALDVYQLGLSLAEALTGRPVVAHRDPGACARAHLAGDLDLPSTVLDRPVGPVIRRALSRDPDARFADAGELGDALRQCHAETLALAPVTLGRVAALPADFDPGHDFEDMPTRRMDWVPAEADPTVLYADASAGGDLQFAAPTLPKPDPEPLVGRRPAWLATAVIVAAMAIAALSILTLRFLGG